MIRSLRHAIRSLCAASVCFMAAEAWTQADVRRHNSSEVSENSAGRVSMRSPPAADKAPRAPSLAAPVRLPVPRPIVEPPWFDTEIYCIAEAASIPSGILDAQAQRRCLEIEEIGKAIATFLWVGIPVAARDTCMDAGARQGQGSYERLARCLARTVDEMGAARLQPGAGQ